MKMRVLVYLLVSLLFCSCQNTPNKTVQKDIEIHLEEYLRHLAYLVQLKNEVAQKTWSGFSKKDFFQPAVYYTYEGTFVLNPNEHIRSITEYEEMNPFDEVKVIKLSEKYTDTVNFNFTTSYIDSDSTALYYQDNVLFFQSFDLTKKLIGVTDLQDWSIMVIHELFHGYQRWIPDYKAYSTQLDIPGGPDEFLGKYHKELPWFKESVQKENQILKSIWIDRADMVTNLIAYDSLRTARIERIKKDYGVDIREVEDYEILMEGHARYFESLCKRHLSEIDVDTSMLEEQDLQLITGIFEGYEIKKDKALYDIYNDRYYYPLGYNISMILETHLPGHTETLYTKDHNFNGYLEKLKVLIDENQ